jgi:hypothetical protein
MALKAAGLRVINWTATNASVQKGGREMLLKRCLALGLIAFGLATAGAAQAPSVPATDAQPLLRLYTARTMSPDVPVDPAPLILTDEDIFISRSGGITSAESTRFTSIGFPFPEERRGRTVLGAGTTDLLSDLRLALQTAQAGVQTSCRAPVRADHRDGLHSGTETVVWYGKGQRQNKFAVRFTDDVSAGPACPPQVEALLAAIRFYREQVAGLPGSLVFVNQ